MPVLTRAHAREAEAVLRGGADVVFGPALDGGYWMVGLSRPSPDLFDLGGDWGGAGGARALARARAGGRACAPSCWAWSATSTTPPTPARWPDHPRLPPAVAEVLG